MDLYWRGIAYGFGEWKKLTSHQKTYSPGDDQYSHLVILVTYKLIGIP